MHKTKIITFLFLAAIGLSGCEMMGGAGRDIQHAGQSIEDSAD